MRAKAIAVHQFVHSIGLTQRVATHTVQKHFAVTEDSAKDFAMMRMKLQGQDRNDILNMDQMPTPYSYHSNKMLKVIGSKSVQQRSSTSETKHITLDATVTASGKMLTPFLIFKGAWMDKSHTHLSCFLWKESMLASQRCGWMRR